MKYELIKPRHFDLKVWRFNVGLSLRKVAKITDSDYSYLYRLEKAAHTASPDMALKIFEALSKWQDKNLPDCQFDFSEKIKELKT